MTIEKPMTRQRYRQVIGEVNVLLIVLACALAVSSWAHILGIT
jgi:hypothetical protein